MNVDKNEITEKGANPSPSHWPQRGASLQIERHCATLASAPTSLNNPCQWMLPTNLPPRKRWYRPHFEVLTYFGVWCTSTHSTIFNVDHSPSVGSQSLCVMKTTPLDADLPGIPTLLHDIRANTSDDAFLGDVLQAVLDSDHLKITRACI